MRPSANTSILAPTRWGVEPVVATIVTSAAASPRSSAAVTAAKTSWFIPYGDYRAGDKDGSSRCHEGHEDHEGAVDATACLAGREVRCGTPVDERGLTGVPRSSTGVPRRTAAPRHRVD